MGIQELKPNSMLYSRLLADNADEVRRSAAKIVRTARGEIHRSENLMARLREVLARTEKELKEIRRKKEQRASKKTMSRTK
jgi:hypothetical protein